MQAGILLLALIGLLVWLSYTWARRRGQLHEGEEPETAPPPRVSLLTEALAYIGAILVLAGGGSAVGQQWDRMSGWGHVAVLAGATVLFLAAGWAARRAEGRAFGRLASVAWFLSVPLFAGTLAAVSVEFLDLAPETAVALVGGGTALFAAALWTACKRALQQAALFGGVLTAVIGSLIAPPGDVDPWVVGLAVWATGLLWTLLGWRRTIAPWWAAVPLGGLVALVAPGVVVAEHGWGYGIAVGTAAAAMGLSVLTRYTPALALGSVAMFAYVTSAVQRYFADTLGAPAGLGLTGLVILAIAVIVARVLRRAGPTEESRGEVAGTKGQRPRRPPPQALRRAS